MEDKKKSGVQQILSLVAPGRELRRGLDNIIRARTGGLIVVGYSDKLDAIIDGGFHVNCAFTPNHIYELSKMDGAIILNDTSTKILYANVQLNPDYTLSSGETGMRHRTAERVAQQTEHLVIAISHRREVITLYRGTTKYTLQDIGYILTKANQALQTLEKYMNVWNKRIRGLSLMELDDVVALIDIISLLHQVEMILRIQKELLNYINELGVEGRLIQLQLDELMDHFNDDVSWLIKDYEREHHLNSEETLILQMEQNSEDLLDEGVIARALGYNHYQNFEDVLIPRGYRLLKNIPGLPFAVVEKLVGNFKTIKNICRASLEDLDQVEGIGSVRAKKIKESLERTRAQLYLNRHS